MTSNERFKTMLKIAAIYERAAGVLLAKRHDGRAVHTAAGGGRGAPSLLGGGETMPDLQVFSANGNRWVEIKEKTTTGVYMLLGGLRTTGMDIHNARQYRRVQEETGMGVMVVFIHKKQDEIRAAWLDDLASTSVYGVNHCEKNGMVYFDYDALPRICGREELIDCMTREDFELLAEYGLAENLRIEFDGALT